MLVGQYVTKRVSALRPSSVREVPVSPATSTRCATRSKFRTSRPVWIHAQAPATSSPSTSTHRQRSSVASTSICWVTSAGPSSASSTANTAVSLCDVKTIICSYNKKAVLSQGTARYRCKFRLMRSFQAVAMLVSLVNALTHKTKTI